jgi:RNA polymerase sigma-70 factor (ECF subfamily)
MADKAVQPNTDWCQWLYDATATPLVLYGRALGLSHSEAEDVLQDTYLALLRLPSRPAQPERYVLRVFRNRALNYRRGLWRRLTRELESQRWFERQPDETGLEREAMRRLALLPQEQREAIVLKLWNRLTFEEIGELLGLSPNTVAGRYRYGLRKLRLCFEKGSYELVESLGEALGIVEAPPTAPRT